jgi:hypothetical protein
MAICIEGSLTQSPPDSISISSSSSDSPQDHSKTTTIDEDTEVEDVKAVEYARKRPRRMRYSILLYSVSDSVLTMPI